MAGYDPKKAAEYNRLIQQGVNPEAAIAQAGITYEEQGNYEINSVGTSASNRDYGKMSGISIGQGKVAGVDYDKAPADSAPAQSQITRVSYTETSTETVSGGGSTTITTGPRLPTAQSQEYAAAGSTKQVEIDEFIKNNPSNFARKRQGLPPLSPEENQARSSQLNSLQDQRSQLYNQQTDAETPSAPTITSTPNTTTTTQTVSTQISASKAPVNFDQDEQLNQNTELQLEKTTTLANTTSSRNSEVNPASDPSQFPAYDDDGNLQPGFAVNDETGGTYYQGFERSTDRPVAPASDPSQFPAYDDDGNLQPGFKINDETGGTYYQGFERTSNEPLNPNEDPFEQSRYEAELAYNAQEPYEFAAPTVDDPYYGLSSTQLQDLGGADPTDPYIRARLGIPQLPGSTLFATGGFGTIKTGVPAIDSALGIIGGGVTSLFSNFSSSIGGLFGAKPTASAVASTTGMSVAGLTTPATTPPTTDTAVNPASDPSQFPAYDDDGNLQPGFAVNEETGGTYYKGVGPATTDTAVNPASDPSQFPAYDDDGNLQPGFAVNEETGGTYYKGVGPGTKDTAVNPASDPSQFPAYDDDGNLQPGFAVNDETGETYFQGVGPATSTDTTTLSAEQADAFYNGTGTPTAAQQAATNEQTAADAAALYPGTNNTNLKNINDASAAVAQNEAGITNAEQIIAENNAELADPNISDERRAELEANNASQENYIRLANDNTAENELVIESNADAFAAGGGNPDSGTGPLEVAALEDPGLDTPVEESVVEVTDAELVPLTDEETAALVEEAEESVVEETEAVDVDPAEDPELAEPQDEEFAVLEEPADVDPEEDPFEASRLEAEQELNRQQLTEEATDVEPGLFTGQTDEFGGVDEAVAIEQADVDTRNDPALSEEEIQAELDQAVENDAAEDVDPDEDDGLQLPPGAEEDEVESEEPFALNPDEDPAIAQQEGGAAEGPSPATTEESFQGAQEAAVKAKAVQQATFQARYKQPGNTDWRVRLSLGPKATYLYNAGTAAGILAPLAATDGVIFPYTPSITTTYSANYEQYDLVHSNYRGIYYKNSRVGDIQIRGTFTAQDTKEADYLLAVIHFFRSATKMFYGQDAERGTPPPVCLLNGLGQYQFSDHPVVISSFNYTLPNDVDYIRAGNPNNYGANMLNRRAAVASNPGGQSLAGLNRLTNALLKKGAPGQGVPDPSAIQQNVSNTAGASYVPTKIEIDITLIPVQTRSQVSKQFSLKGFANGQLLKGGFW